MQIVKEELPIVYCAYANQCELLSLSFSQFGCKSGFYTGKLTSARDKLDIYHNMKRGDIQILAATKVFGMGVNLPDIRHVIQVGIPENLALWIKEFGGAGRDGKQSHAHLLIFEHVDLKRLYFWTKNCSVKTVKIYIPRL